MSRLRPTRPAIGSRVVRLESVLSSNDVARQLARAGEPHGTIVVALEQTAGRGQRGRHWASPRGGLWLSLLLRPLALGTARLGLLNIAAAVAAAEAASATSRVSVQVKWPNDLLVAGRKVGGVLVETFARAANTEWAIVGIGINANVSIQSLPTALRRSATSLSEQAGHEIPLDLLLHDVCSRTERLLDVVELGGDEQVLARWRAIDTTRGRRVESTAGDRWSGLAEGVDRAGRLIVRNEDGGLIAISTTRGLSIA